MKRLERTIPWTDEHLMYREMAENFFDNEVAPNLEQWDKDRIVPRSSWEKAGGTGLLCPDFPEKYGASGVDFLYNAIVIEEGSRVGNSGFFHSLHSEVVAPYLLHFTADPPRERWLPGVIDGSKILAIAMTEPDTGSDLANIKSSAEDKGDHYVLNGSKTFISNGYLSDVVIVAAKTNPDKGIHGVSLMVVERDTKGFKRGRKLD